MRKIFRVLTLSLLLGSFGCTVSSDDDDVVPVLEKSFEYKEKDYSLAEAGIELYSSTPSTYGSYRWHANLISSGLSFNSYGSVSGSGNRVRMYFNSSSSQQVALGTYVLKYQSESLTMSSVYITTSDDITLYASSGSCIVSRDDDVYTFSFVFVMTNGETVTGEYSGELQKFE